MNYSAIISHLNIYKLICDKLSFEYCINYSAISSHLNIYKLIGEKHSFEYLQNLIFYD